MKLPCGCGERKEIMLEHGKPDLSLVLVVGVPLAVLLTVVYLRKASA